MYWPVAKEISVLDFSILALVATWFSQAQCFINFSRGYYEEHSCKIMRIWTSGSGDDV